VVSECVSQCVLLNARSLKNKLCDLNHLLPVEYFAVSITDSWLNSSVTNAMIDVSGRYNVHQNDRLTRQGGGVPGVLCLVNNKWTSFTIPLPENFQDYTRSMTQRLLLALKAITYYHYRIFILKCQHCDGE